MRRVIETVVGLAILAVALVAYLRGIGPWYAAFGLAAFGGFWVSKSLVLEFLSQVLAALVAALRGAPR